MVAVTTGVRRPGVTTGPGGAAPPGGVASGRPDLRTVRRVYLVAFAALVTVYVFASSARHPLLVAFGVLGAAAVGYGTVVLQPRRWAAWSLVGSAVLLLGVALATTVGQRPPVTIEVIFLAAYVPLAIGLLGLGRATTASRDWPALLDTISLALAGALLVWIVLIRPAVVNQHMTEVGKFAAVATWVGFTAVFAACARLLLLWRANRSAILLSAGVAAYLLGDFLYARSAIRGTLTLSHLAEAGFLAFFGLVGLAALMPGMASIAGTLVGQARYELSPRRLVLIGLTLLVAPTVLLVEASSGPVTAGVAISIVSGVIGLLMVVRLSLGATAYRRRGISAVAVRVALRSLVVATTATEVTTSLTQALRAMLPRRDGVHAWVIQHSKPGHPSETDDVMGTRTLLSQRDDGLGELLVHVGEDALPVTASYAIVYTAPIRYLVESASALEALAEQAGAALARIDLVGALQVEERERYFRTLVLTSTDATLICRNGRVDYATPAAEPMFGRDVHGAVFDGLIDGAHESTVDGHQGLEGTVHRPDGSSRIVLAQQRDLTDDPTVNGMVVTVRDMTAERELQRSLAYRATHDALTGLANSEQLREQMRVDRNSASSDAMSAVLFVDLDDFKQVNDTYGHEVGDGLLVNVAYRIRSCLRNNDLAARLGGDEFAALLRGVPDEDAARRTAQRIADSLARPVHVAGLTVDSGASVGLAVARTPMEFDSLLRRADTALYIAKADGKGHWREYEEGMISPIRRRSDLRIELENAMRDDTLALHYQPIVELATGQAVGFEGLIRFDRTGGGSIPPQELIRIAEENGLIVPLGEWVIGRVLRDLAVLSPADRYPRPYVSVNVSPNQLRQNGFADSVRDRLELSGVDPSLLVLEITERLAVAEDAQAWAYLNELRASGVRVAIDDYGTGYASLSYLRQLAIDVVKIDRSFVQDLTTQREQMLLEAVIRLTAQLGLTTIAEGVETARSRDILLSMGCRFGQGFYYSPPMPLPGAVAWANAHLPVS